MNITERRAKLLAETIAYFNLNTRCISDVNRDCVYAPTEKSEGCAVGRLIPDKNLCIELDKLSLTVANERVYRHLSSDVQELGIEFLRALQRLHDNVENWTLNGLSESGKAIVETITENYIKE